MGVKVFAFMTGERVTPESAEFGDAESRGWVDPRWSMRVFYESRNDVTPVIDEWLPGSTMVDGLAETPEEFAERVRDALNYIGPVEDNGDGTFYTADSVVLDYSEAGDYRYALHFTIKDQPNYGERAWHPREAGINISDLCV